MLKGIVPGDSFWNNLDLEDVPKELGRLNSLEHHLVALNIPFMKILGLPKRGQKGVHGPVICVPSDLKKGNNYTSKIRRRKSFIESQIKEKVEI